MIELRHLETFKAVAESGSITRAAKRIHLSQPAVSHQIRLMEEAYGVGFFERKTNPLKLTPAGERLLSLAYTVSEQVSAAQRDLARIGQGNAGQLRIAVECHSCFDWLMPSMDVFRDQWPEVEMDLVSGFQPDPIGLLDSGDAELVIVSQAPKRSGIVYYPLFSYDVFALLAKTHPLTRKPYLTARDFANQTLVTYPIPDDRLDLVRDVLKPAKIEPERRTAMLTVAILQLVASGRGVSALPGWTIQPYLERRYVVAKPIRKNGLRSRLYAATSRPLSEMAYMQGFLNTVREICVRDLKYIYPMV